MKKSNPIKNKEKIVIGFVSGLSGVYGWMARDQLRGVQLAAEEWNKKGGLMGHKITVVSKDDKSDTNLSQKYTKELIVKNKADFILGGLSAPTHPVINKEARKGKRIFISLGQSIEINMAPNVSPYTFHEALTPHMAAEGAGHWAAQNLGKKWYLVLADYGWGRSVNGVLTNLAKKEGVKILGRSWIPFPALGKDDFTKHFENIIKKKPEVLVVGNFGTDQVKFIEEANKAGLKTKMSIMHVLSDVRMLERIDPNDSVGMYWGANFYWGMADIMKTAKGFVSGYMKKFKQVPSGYAAYGYSGTLEVLEATKVVNKYPLDQIEISKTMEGGTYSHYSTSQWWRPCDHQSMMDYHIFKLKGPEERKSSQDLAETVGKTSWDLGFERDCVDLGHRKNLWGHSN